MGLLTMTEEEYQYYVDNIREAFDLIGQKAILFQIDQEVKDLYQDKEQLYREGKIISLVFEDNPKPTLKKFNWLTEDDNNPIVAHIVAKASDGDSLEIRDGMKILLISEHGLRTARAFKVANVVGSSIDPLTWICKLVPYRYKEDVDQQTSGYQSKLDSKELDTDFSYLRTT